MLKPSSTTASKTHARPGAVRHLQSCEQVNRTFDPSSTHSAPLHPTPSVTTIPKPIPAVAGEISPSQPSSDSAAWERTKAGRPPPAPRRVVIRRSAAAGPGAPPPAPPPPVGLSLKPKGRMDAAELEMFERRRALAKQVPPLEGASESGRECWKGGQNERAPRAPPAHRRRPRTVVTEAWGRGGRRRAQVLPHRNAPPTAEGIVYVPDWNRESAGSVNPAAAAPPPPAGGQGQPRAAPAQVRRARRRRRPSAAPAEEGRSWGMARL